MIIAIRSEMDSRPLLYPLLRCLKPYGNVLVVSTNKTLNRLVETPEDGGFRGIHVIVDESGATDNVFEMYNIEETDYSYIILDNMGVTEYDKYLVMLGARQSEDFRSDVRLLLESDDENKVKVLQFGKLIDKELTSEINEMTRPEESEDYDPAEKFRESEKKAVKAKMESKITTVQFPQYQSIENLEAFYVFYEVDSIMVGVFYELFKDSLQVKEIDFRREVQKKDANSRNIGNTAGR